MKKLAAILALLLLVSSAFHAQTTNGSIQGSVTDESGGTVPGATVTARNMDTGLTQVTTTTDAGVYYLPNLPPGRYSITFEAANLKKLSQEGVTVSVGTTTPLNVQLRVGVITESVTVSADASQLQTTTSDIGA